MNLRRISVLCLSVCLLVLSYSSTYSQEFDKVEISTIKVSENITGDIYFSGMYPLIDMFPPYLSMG